MVMTIKYLTDAEKLESRALWEDAFPEDAGAFADYYFSDVISGSRVLAIAEASIPGTRRAAQTQAAVRERKTIVTERARTWRLESMVHCNPYQVQAGSLRWEADSLAGVATRTEKRRRGYISTLLSRVLKDLREEQRPFCFLRTANETIFRPFGFVPVFRQPQWSWRPGAVEKLTKRPLLPWYDNNEYSRRAEDAARFMNEWLERHARVHTLRDGAYVLRLLDEVSCRGGSFDVCYDGDRVAAVCAAWGEDAPVQRIFYAEDAYAEQIGESAETVMVRIVCPEVFVKAVCLKPSAAEDERKLRLRLEDSVIDNNNRTWNWRLDRRGSRLERVYEDSLVRAANREPPDLALTAAELTSWLFGQGIPEAARPYADLVGTLSGVYLDETV